jgi:hypothetical protein
MSTRLAPAPTVEPPAATPLSWRSWRWWVVPLGALALFAVWLRSLDDVALAKTAGWGLLPALPSSWYGAFAGTILLYLWALLSRHRIGHTLAALHVVLVSLLFATTAVVYDAPRYPWTYKHIGVVDYLLQHGTVDRSIDIYMNFPAFFYLAAGVHHATGVPVEELARWAQPFHALVAAAAVYWVVGGLSTARRVRYGATLICTLGDWIGQNYFAPQALAFPVALFVLGGLLRSVPPGAEGFRFAWLADRFPRVPEADLPPGSGFWRSGWGALVLVLGFTYAVVSHPLSPVLLLAQSVGVYLLLRPVRRWLPLLFLTIEAVWLALAWPFLTSTYELFSFGLDNVAPPQVAVTEPLPGYTTALWAAPVLMGVLALLTLWASATAYFRRGRAARVLVPLGLAAVPVAMVLAQPYGNEGIFRAYLFALPWAAFLIALQVFDEQRAWTPQRRLIAWGAVVVVAVLTLPANFAGEMSYRVAASDVAADEFFEERTPEGSVLLPFTSSFPTRSTGEYPDHLPRPTEGTVGLDELPGFAAAATDQDDLIAFTLDSCDTRPGGGPVYLVLGPAAEDTVRLFGTMELYTYRAYQRVLSESPDLSEVFRQGRTVVYQCRF